MAVTIKDVAEYTGLSVSTVSLVLNGKANALRISPETIQRVLDAAEELNYRPNMLAKSLREGYTRIIGFVVSDVANSFFIKIAGHLEAEALKFGYRVIFGGANENDHACIDTIDAFVNLKVDGLVIVPTEGVAERLIALKKQKIPFVLLDRYFKGLDVDSVLMNNYKSAYDATRFLASKGRKIIATLSYDTTLLHMEERMDGYRAAMADSGLRYRPSLAPRIPFSADLPQEEITAIIRRLVETEGTDAIFFQTNTAAVAGLRAMRELGYDVPEQVAVICFNDNPFYDLLEIPVSSMVQPTDELGVEAVHLLLPLINGNGKNAPAEPAQHSFDAYEIIDRS